MGSFWEPQERQPWPLLRCRSSPSEFWGLSPGPGLRLPPALIDGFLAETLEQLPQFLAQEVFQEGRWSQKGGGARARGLGLSE